MSGRFVPDESMRCHCSQNVSIPLIPIPACVYKFSFLSAQMAGAALFQVFIVLGMYNFDLRSLTFIVYLLTTYVCSERDHPTIVTKFVFTQCNSICLCKDTITSQGRNLFSL